MQLYPHKIYHVYNRGNQQQKIFFTPANYFFFLKKMRKELVPHCEILAYCLMPNHFHWLLQVKEGNTHPMTYITEGGYPANNPGIGPGSHRMSIAMPPLSKAISVLLRSYTRAIQKQETFTGSLFQQKTKAKEIATENHALICANYIHQNPMRAKLVKQMEDWSYSSFNDHCGFRNGTLCNKPLFREIINISSSEDFRKLSYDILPPEELDFMW